ncbi:hypothetical protein FQR65_LT19473 [Abscondita terminalis]|nr:hypothetical protein FQR65_LT19473 [Abscondita terminalis]
MILQNPQVGVIPNDGTLTEFSFKNYKLYLSTALFFGLGIITQFGIGTYPPALAILSSLGFSVEAAFPIMMCEAAQASKTPLIIATSEGAMKYMGGPKVVVGMVNGLLESLNITVPVSLHLDHGQSLEAAKLCIMEGYSSVMFDGSHFPYAENLAKTKELMEFAKSYEVSVEAEIGSIGGEEDGVVGAGELGDPKEAAEMSKTGITMLAAGIDACKMPMVLHGGSGIPNDQVIKAIKLGISKINVNTELQLAFRDATRAYIEAKKDLDDETKGFDPRKLLNPGYKALQETFNELTKTFGCYGKAN